METSTCHSFLNIPDPVGGVIVPQKVHVPPQAGAFTPGETIRFSHNGEPGVRMVTALTSCRECGDECTGLEGGDTISPIAVEGDKISIRLNWPGCQPWIDPVCVRVVRNGQISTVDKFKLARDSEVAKAVQKFYGRYQRSSRWENSAEWAPNTIPFKSLVLHELRHVSKGSYQPVVVVCPA